MAKQHLLTDLEISKIDLVDNPANPGAQVVLFKSAKGADAAAAEHLCAPLLKAEDLESASFDEALAETEGRMKAFEVMDQVHPLMGALHDSVRSIFEAETGDARKAKLRESVQQFLKEIRSRLSEIGKSQMSAADIEKFEAAIKRKEGETDMDEKQVQELIGAAIEKATKPLTEKLTTLTTENESLRKRLAGVAPVKEPDTTPVTKADLERLNPADREAVEKQATALQKANEEIAKLQVERAIDLEERRIEKQYPHLPEEYREAAKDLLSIPAENTAARERFEKRLEMANKGARELVTPHGVDVHKTADGKDPLVELQKKADEIVAKGNLSPVEAFEMAQQQNPELMAAIEEERNA
jgi:hypothetical protein